MHALIVLSHPDSGSLTHAVATRLADGVGATGHTASLADLAAEGFDPRFSAADIAAHRGQAPIPADIHAEQQRIDRADALVLVYPVYWWSMPGLLKGWIDRVFSNGWAYDDRSGKGIRKLLGRLPVHLVALGGADLRTYARHGYFGAMRTQIDHGIFDYCGAPVATTELMVDTDPGETAAAHLDTAHALGRRLFATHRATDAA